MPNSTKSQSGRRMREFDFPFEEGLLTDGFYREGGVESEAG